jgi:hypothetical protein
MIEIKNNFLPIEQFNELQKLIFDLEFPWRLRENMAGNDGNIYFTHSFFNENNVTSELYFTYIVPILKKLNSISPIQIRVNMFLNKLFNESDWHSDYNLNNTTAILYLNDCNGGTELKIKNEVKFIKAEKNKLIIFPSKTIHRVKTSTDVDKRYIINFNYFEKDK